MWRPYQLLSPVYFCLFLQAILSLSSSSSSSAAQFCSHDESAALIQFKSSFSIDETYSAYCDNLAGIKSYPKTNSWKKGNDCCQWDGVTCDNHKGQVIGLDLSCSWLYGSFPSNSTLFLLPHLQKLNLAFNFFDYSEMSSEFGRFASLVYLNLSNTYFSGKVPSQLSHLSKLVSLDLSGNYEQSLEEHTLQGLVQNLTEVRQLLFDGVNMASINPNVLMNLSSSLRSLSLNGCDLRGKFQINIFDLPNLKLLNLGGNWMLSLHLQKFNRSSHLEHLDLSLMFFSTKLIDSIDNLLSLKYLYLSGTFASKGLSSSIWNLLSLEHLDASQAEFYGGILPGSMGNLVSLKHLDLRYCNFSGSIPRPLGNLLQLNYLDLSLNGFGGQIPSSFTNLTQLEFLNVESNQLEGSIPDEVNAFPYLISLSLSSNLFNGTLPSWIYVASSLKYIDLSHNQFCGHIKEFQSKSLEVIHLSYNKLQGSIPSSISQLVNLTSLDLSSNNLSGTLDFGIFSNLQHLQTLRISGNNPSLDCNGTSVDYTLPDLQSLSLPSCNINEFPQFLKGSKYLKELDLSSNKIYGEIPKWMWDVGKNSFWLLNLSHNFLTKVEQLPWRKIQILDLSSNLIHGDLPIPASTINVFFISNNNLSGELSSEICNASSLQFLNLSHNNLNGSIPQCFGNLGQSVWTMNLQMNKFSGIVPTFAKGCELRNLNLNGNQLEGPLTRSILNCTDLEALDLGNNKINDTFPFWLESLPQLQVLVLRSNQFNGPIYDTRSNPFPKIQIFDLSSNYLTGPLPLRYIKSFKAMINLEGKGSELSYMGMKAYDGGLYSYSIRIAIKGQEIQLVKIFFMLTSIDLSNNKFEGKIPEAIGKLNSLKGLNLSHNNLSGCIPTTIGNLTSLEWLDLSSNQMVGTIPKSLLNLASLAVFNVSENQLSGKIPEGKQFNTFGNDSYEGNKGLCGFPVSKGCNNNNSPSLELPPSISPEKTNFKFGWNVVLIGYGCGVIFGLAMGYVVFQTGKPIWLVSFVEDQYPKRRRKPNIGNRHGARRRS